MEIWKSLALLLVILLVLLGNANKLGNKEASQYVTNDRFAVITGSINCRANTLDRVQEGECSYTNIDLNFPPGFTSKNCVVLTINSISLGNRGFAYLLGRGPITALDMSWGTEPIKIMLGFNNQEIIKLSVGNYDTNEIVRHYKIVLMKID